MLLLGSLRLDWYLTENTQIIKISFHYQRFKVGIKKTYVYACMPYGPFQNNLLHFYSHVIKGLYRFLTIIYALLLPGVHQIGLK